MKKIQKIKTNVPKIDKLLGGGFARGFLTLLSAERATGKTTLLLQLAARTAGRAHFITTEQSVKDMRLITQRLNLDEVRSSVEISSVEDLQQAIKVMKVVGAGLVIIDSAHNLAGSWQGVASALKTLKDLAFASNIAIVVVGHAKPDGEVPKFTQPHSDVQIYLERNEAFEITMHIDKNRFAAAGTSVKLGKISASGFAL